MAPALAEREGEEEGKGEGEGKGKGEGEGEGGRAGMCTEIFHYARALSSGM